MRYSVEPKALVFAKGYGVLSFAKNKGKNISQNISCKYTHWIVLNNQLQMRCKLLSKGQF